VLGASRCRSAEIQAATRPLRLVVKDSIDIASAVQHSYDIDAVITDLPNDNVTLGNSVSTHGPQQINDLARVRDGDQRVRCVDWAG
jgi:hypothetical protein